MKKSLYNYAKFIVLITMTFYFSCQSDDFSLDDTSKTLIDQDFLFKEQTELYETGKMIMSNSIMYKQIEEHIRNTDSEKEKDSLENLLKKYEKEIIHLFEQQSIHLKKVLDAN